MVLFILVQPHTFLDTTNKMSNEIQDLKIQRCSELLHARLTIL